MKLAIPLLAALLSLPSLAAAQDAAPPRAQRRAPTRGEDIIVRVDIQRPFAFAVTGRSPLGYTALDDQRSFAPEVTQAVRRDPF
jgi:hypothetical protein